MRFAGLTLERYGPFGRLEVPLDPAPGRLNLVVAPNGWGKSVLRQAMQDFLFGIPERTPMGFAHGLDRMRLLADVVDDEGTRRIIRRKGRGNTLAYADEAPVPPEVVRRLLGGADEALFRELFGLDTALLREGGRALLESQGRLGQVLFAASGGMGRVRAVLDRLRTQRDDLGLAGRRHKARPIWAALSDFEQAQVALNRSALRPEGWRALERAAEAAATALRELRTAQAVCAAALRQRRMVQAIRTPLGRYADTQAVLDAASDVPRLDPSFEPRWREAVAAAAQAAATARSRAEDAAAARLAAEAIEPDPTWLAHAPEIAALAALRGDAQGAVRDLPEVSHEHAVHVAEAGRLRLVLGGDADDGAAEAVAALADVAAALRAGGDPVARVQAGRAGQRASEAAFAAALAAIPDTKLSEASLGLTSAPALTTLDAACAALDGAQLAHAQAQRDRDARAAEIAAVETELLHLTQHVALPAPGALAAARAARDGMWTTLSGRTPRPSEALAFERAVRDADAVADALVAHGGEAARADALRAHRAAHARQHARAVAAIADGAASLDAARAALDGVAVAAGAAEGVAPGALRAFIEARRIAVDARLARDRAAASAGDTETALAALGDRLAGLLGAVPAQVEALAPLLAAADRRIAAARARDVTLAELRGAEVRRDDAALRIANMNAAVARFAGQVDALAAALAPHLAGRPAFEALVELEQRQLVAQTAAVQRHERESRAALTAETATGARAQAAAAASALAALRAALAATDDADAERLLARARAVTDAAAQHADAAAELARLGGGRDVATLATLATASQAADDAAEIERLDAEQAALAPLLEAAVTERDRTTAARDAAEQGDAASDAAARRAAAQAALGRHAEDALVLHAAVCLLQAALERQAAGADAPLLARIGARFRAVTAGAHAGVAADGAEMVALQADGIARNTLGQLSEGTRDQLYLALRIAALEDYAALAPPLPFVADDVLQTFDDVRTAASLGALLDLSRQVQVIALTHHPHVAALAAAALPAGALNLVAL